MRRTKTVWPEPPLVPNTLQQLFHARPAGGCRSLPLAAGFVQDVLDCIPETVGSQRHYTQTLRDELKVMTDLDKNSFIAVKVTEFVLLQKDIDLLIKGEIDCAKPDADFISCLRDLSQKMADVREQISKPALFPTPKYTNDL